MQLTLPTADGTLKKYTLAHAEAPFARVKALPWNRVAYAAAHVVVDPLQPCDPWDGAPVIDWEATLRFREHLWGLGFKIAEAMDTAQRGMGLDWPGARELIVRSVAPCPVFSRRGSGMRCGHRQLLANDRTTLADVMRAYEEQIAAVESAGGRIILMASRALAAVARNADDYGRVYGDLLGQCRQKVVLHWLGEMFDPALKGYWGTTDIAMAMQTVLDIVRANAEQDRGHQDFAARCPLGERHAPQSCPPGVMMFTGDDFNYDELIAGDGTHHSHALLGIFDPIATVAAAALNQLAAGDADGYKRNHCADDRAVAGDFSQIRRVTTRRA
jgi:hypothetical protein